MLKYIGEGAYLQGVPARDLTDAEASEFGGEEALAASGLYIGAAGPDEGAIAVPMAPAVSTDEPISTARRREGARASEVKHGR